MDQKKKNEALEEYGEHQNLNLTMWNPNQTRYNQNKCTYMLKIMQGLII